MQLADIGRALGYGVVSGLGTATEQRTREEKQQALALAFLKSQMADARSRDAVTAANERARLGRESAATLAGIGRTSAETIASDREAGLNARVEPDIAFDPRSGAQLQQGRNLGNVFVPGTETQAEFMDLPATPEEPPTQVVSKPAYPGDLAPTVKRSAFPATLKDILARGKETGKIAKIGEARKRVQGGETWESVAGEYPELTAKDVYGYEPAAPTKPEKEYTDHNQANGQITRVFKDGTVKILQKGEKTPTEKNPLDEEYKRLRNARLEESSRVMQSVESIEELAAEGKATPKQISQAIRDLNADADKNLKAILDGIVSDEADVAMLKQSAMDQKRRAVALDRFRKGSAGPVRSGAGGLGGVADKWGIKLPGAK